ncbi:glycoside hydrolase family 25 protein [Propionibacterium freudenreichii]|uniref:glycoside hydrolase family 25 protein n=1 Tax=Propionibacterium freudenreichii TaxID=1744 RepID=UPI0038553BA5
MAFGIDVSSYQAPDGALLDGMSFCIIKATEGTGYINPNRAQWHAVARSRGVTTGAYHFMRGGDAGSQADYFLAHLPGDVDWLALDVEDAGDGLSWSGRVGFILDWHDRVAATGKPVLVYCSRSWAVEVWDNASQEERDRLAAIPLWMADYTGAPGEYSGAVPDGWPITIHQFTSTPVDKNIQLSDVSGGDMPLSTDDLRNIATAVWGGGGAASPMYTDRLDGHQEYPETALFSLQARLGARFGELAGKIDGLAEALKQVQGGNGVDTDAVKAAATEGAKAGVQAIIEKATINLEAK